MANDIGNSNRSGDGGLDPKSVWVAIDLLEECLDRNLDQKIDTLTKEIRQMFADHVQGESTSHTSHLDWNRFFPRG